MAGKVRWWSAAPADAPGLARLLAADFLVIGSAILVCDIVRRVVRRSSVTWLLLLVSLPVVALCFFEALSLSGTGVSLHLSSIRLALARWGDVAAAGDTELGIGTVVTWGALTLIPIALSVALWLRSRSGEPFGLLLGFAVLLIGVLSSFSPPTPGAYASHSQHVTTRLILQLVRSPDGRDLRSLEPLPPLVDEPQLPADSPNIVLIVLEGVGYSETSLANPALDRTPFLAQLGQSGMVFEHVRATTPHTSKALYGILCGRYPARNWELVEAADNFPVACLPHVLGARGYGSIFLQSADGTFERRPRLVHRLGFDRFVARQDLGDLSSKVGYLGGDDHGLIPATVGALQERDRPLFVTVLTSITHYPYLLPPSSPAMRSTNAMPDPHQRYNATIQYTDSWLGALFQELAGADLLRNTLFIVVSDHGEVFSGGRVGRGHSNVLAEETLRVPLVLWGPIIRRPGRDSAPRSLIDIAPTVLEILDVEAPQHFEGSSLRDNAPPERWLLSASWFPEGWLVAVRADEKVAWFVEQDRVVGFALPSEGEVRLPTSTVTAAMDLLVTWQEETYFDIDTADFSDREFYSGTWTCDESECWHTETQTGLVYTPDERERLY